MENNSEIHKLFADLFLKYRIVPKVHEGNTVVVAALRKDLHFNKLIEILNVPHNSMTEHTNKSGTFKFFTEEQIYNIHCVKEEDLDWIADNYSYSLPPILGKIFKGSNLILNEEGLRYVQKYKNAGNYYECGSFVITKEYRKILEILKLDFQEWSKGFQNTTEIFEFVCKCPYLKPEEFIKDNEPIRNETLSNFRKFILENQIQKDAYELTLEYIASYFPEVDFFAEIKKLEEAAKLKHDIVTKFDGRTIMEVFPNLEKKKVGEYYGRFKSSFENSDSFLQFIIENSKEQIITKLKEVVQ